MSPATAPQLLVALPALGAVAAALILLLVEALWRRTVPWLIDGIALAGLAVTGILQLAAFGAGAGVATLSRGGAGGGALVAQDALASFGGLIIVFAAAFTLLSGGAYAARRGLRRAEYTVIVLFAVAGMLLLCAAADLIVVFIGVEAFSIALYILCAFRAGDRRGYEAALKYFVLGALAAGFLLYGTALVYAGVGTTELARVGAALATDGGAAGQTTALAGLALILVGLGFKLALVPFHQWAPDVYQGAPTPVTGLMAAATKTAAAVALARVLWTAFPALADAWQPLVAVVAVLTMLVGNLGAMVQSNVKRMLAYSAVAHAGYVLVAIIAAPTGGVTAALYYLLAYGMATLGAFGVLAALDAFRTGPPDGDAVDAVALTDLAGLGKRRPWLAAALAVCLVSLVGLPPAAGFLGKFMIFQSAVAGGWTGLAVVLVLNSALSAFYYLRPLGWMYMVAPAEAPADASVGEADEVDSGAAFALTVAVVGTLAALLMGSVTRAARAADPFDRRPPDAAPRLPAPLAAPTLAPAAGPGIVQTMAPAAVPMTPVAPDTPQGAAP